jgi:hypothetical protein
MLEIILVIVALALPMAAGAYLENKFGSRLRARIAALEAEIAALKVKL